MLRPICMPSQSSSISKKPLHSFRSILLWRSAPLVDTQLPLIRRGIVILMEEYVEKNIRHFDQIFGTDQSVLVCLYQQCISHLPQAPDEVHLYLTLASNSYHKALWRSGINNNIKSRLLLLQSIKSFLQVVKVTGCFTGGGDLNLEMSCKEDNSKLGWVRAKVSAGHGTSGS